MRNKDYRSLRKIEHHPMVGVGIFFVVLGIALIVATNDLFNFGSVSSYFNWKTAMIFIGVILVLNLEFTGGLLLMAGGVWFLREELFPFSEETFDIFFWPSVIALIGLSFIMSSLLRKK